MARIKNVSAYYFAKKALNYLVRTVGEWWKDKNFRLWDIAVGTGNLEFAIPPINYLRGSKMTSITRTSNGLYLFTESAKDFLRCKRD